MCWFLPAVFPCQTFLLLPSFFPPPFSSERQSLSFSSLALKPPWLLYTYRQLEEDPALHLLLFARCFTSPFPPWSVPGFPCRAFPGGAGWNWPRLLQLRCPSQWGQSFVRCCRAKSLERRSRLKLSVHGFMKTALHRVVLCKLPLQP